MWVRVGVGVTVPVGKCLSLLGSGNWINTFPDRYCRRLGMEQVKEGACHMGEDHRRVRKVKR